MEEGGKLGPLEREIPVRDVCDEIMRDADSVARYPPIALNCNRHVDDN